MVTAKRRFIFLPIVDRYILKEFLVALAFCILLCCILFLTLDFFYSINDIFGHNLIINKIIGFFSLRLIVNLNEAFTLATLIACIYTIVKFGSNNEFNALLGSGIPPCRILAPIYVSTIILIAFSYYLNLGIIPECNFKAKEILNSSNHNNFIKDISKNIIFTSNDNKRLWVIDTFENLSCINNLQIKKYDSSRNLVLELYAKEADYTDQGDWEFHNVNLSYYKNMLIKSDMLVPILYNTEKLNKLNRDSNIYNLLGDINETPTDILESRKGPWDRSTSDLLKIIHYADYDNKFIHTINTELFRRLSFPLLPIICTIFAAPYLLRNLKRNLSIKVILSLSILILYVVLNALCSSAGYDGILPYWIGAVPTGVLIICALITNFGPYGLLEFCIKRQTKLKK